ncbi:MAG: hypothetical protein JW829_07890 [Pirellulales bacterium]|nr:hypothetical protein [Pirellulales bacterium]
MIHIHVGIEHELHLQMYLQPDAQGAPICSFNVTEDLGELIEETFTRGVLAEKFPADPATIHVNIRPIYLQEPAVAKVQVQLVAGENGEAGTYYQDYTAGRWIRTAQWKALQLRESGRLSQDQTAYRLLVALERSSGALPEAPLLQSPPVEDSDLDAAGVRRFSEGSLESDRPVLVNARFAADAIRRCEEAGNQETGGAVLGKLIRLPQPLPGTETRIVTILASLVEDPRHVGMAAAFNFSPEGLVEAARIGELRGLGESVLTVFHSHGWSPHCRNCKPKVGCLLAKSSPSLQDYEMLSLFPSKGTLMPIAGRKPGVQGDRPILRIFAWRGGQLKAIRWQQYED